MFQRPSPLVAMLLLAPACASPESASPVDPGGGGGAGGEPGCSDLSATGSCRAERQGACQDDQVCSLPRSRSCGATRCCTLPFECQSPVGTTPGGFRCEADDDCTSGVCVPVSGGGLCLRPCELTGSGSTCPAELACVVVGLGTFASVRTCLGTEDGAIAPGRSLCRKDRECAEGRYCRIFGGTEFLEGGAHGVCVPGSRSGEAGLSCERDTLRTGSGGSPVDASDLCPETGLCYAACAGFDPDVCDCNVTPPGEACRGAHCSMPCGADAECPDRYVCRPPDLGRMSNVDPALLFNHCLFPNYIGTDWGCFDETDCCTGGVQRSGAACCNASPSGLGCSVPAGGVTHCRVELSGSRFLSICREPEGKAELGEPCSSAADCESALCGPDGSCLSPCLPGASDRCAELLPGSTCCPLQAGEACVPACRLDCATGPSCAS